MYLLLFNIILNALHVMAIPIHFNVLLNDDNDNYNNGILYRIILYIISLIVSIFILLILSLLLVLYYNKFVKK
jgi:hypothetical protein